MTGKTHQIIGITSGVGWYVTRANPTYGPATLAFLIVSCYFAALLPDIDQPAAKIWRFPGGKAVGKIVDPFLEHRNISHSLLGFFIVTSLFCLLIRSFPSYWGIDKIIVLIGFSVSYLSHILADMITVEGVPMLFPYQRMFGLPPKPFEGARIMTGKWFENLVLFPLFNLILLLMVVLNWRLFKIILFK